MEVEHNIQSMVKECLNLQQAPMNETLHNLGNFNVAQLDRLRSKVRNHYASKINIGHSDTIFSIAEKIKHEVK